MITTIKYSSVVYSKEENIKYMKNYDNYFLPVDNMAFLSNKLNCIC